MSLKEIKNTLYHYYLNDAGDIHGEYKSYHYNGQLWCYCQYKNRKLHGEYKSYHDDGKLEYHCHYKNGELHGEYKRYHRNGQLEFHSYDVNDVVVHDFLKEDSEFIRTCLYMTHGAPWLGGSDAT